MSSRVQKRAKPLANGTSKIATRRRRHQVSNFLAQIAGGATKLSPERENLLAGLQLRSQIMVALFIVLFLALLGRVVFLSTSPLVRMQTALVVGNSEPSAIPALIQHVERLSHITKNIETTSLGDIQVALEDTKRIAGRAAADFQAQYDAWSLIRGQIKNDSSTYTELRSQLAEVQRMQEEEVLRWKRMFDAAQQPSIYADAFNLFLSFALGVFGSLVASSIYARWQARLGGNRARSEK